MAWINSFPKETRNIMLNEKNSDYGSYKKLLYNAKLNFIAPHLIQKVIPKEQVLEDYNYDEIKRPVIDPSIGMKIEVRPKFHDITEVQNEAFNGFENIITESMPNQLEIIEHTHQDIALALENPISKLDYPKVHFLGTGSAFPNNYRNHSGILIETQPDNFIMLDCGENIFHQMYQHFGQKRCINVLKNLKMIYVSHLHADHYLGVIGMILQREKYFQEIGEVPPKMYVMTPPKLTDPWIYYHQHFEPILTNIQIVHNICFLGMYCWN